MDQPIIQKEIMGQMFTNERVDLLTESQEKPVMLVFLRHFGCMFCREALSDISKRKGSIEEMGTKIIFVHMSDNETAEKFFKKYKLSGIPHISDPNCKFYAEFGLTKGNFTQLFGLRAWMRGFQTAIVKQHGMAPPIGDGFQMPGVFVIQDGEIQEAFIHKLSSDRPDYEKLVRSCCSLPS